MKIIWDFHKITKLLTTDHQSTNHQPIAPINHQPTNDE